MGVQCSVYPLTYLQAFVWIGNRNEATHGLLLRIEVEESKSLKGDSLIFTSTLRELGLDKLAGAVMYVMREVFLLEEQYMICPVDEKRGKVLLRDVMLMGNVGHHDEKQKEARKTMAGSLWWKVKRDFELLRFYPAETLSEPIWKIVRMINK